MRRKLSDHEVARIAHDRPWFGRARVLANRDLEEGDAEVLRFRVRRAWDVNECGPGCCPRAFLLETDGGDPAGDFVYLESWNVLPERSEIRTECEAHRTVHGKKLLAFHTAGHPVSPGEVSVRDALLDFEAAECEVLTRAQLPPTFLEIVRTSTERVPRL